MQRCYFNWPFVLPFQSNAAASGHFTWQAGRPMEQPQSTVKVAPIRGGGVGVLWTGAVLLGGSQHSLCYCEAKDSILGRVRCGAALERRAIKMAWPATPPPLFR